MDRAAVPQVRYEVRLPDGRLIGTLSGPGNYGQTTLAFAVMAPLGHAGISGDEPINIIEVETRLDIKEVRLRVVPVHWGTEVIPTLVLASGKRSWLNRVRGFRRI